MKIFRSYCSRFSKRKGSSALILGSTPEFRDLLSGLDVKTVCADYSSENYSLLGKYLKKPLKDSLVKTDWREMEFEEEFDLIIGDQSTQMVPYADIPKVLEGCNRALNRGGLCVLRSGVRSSDEKPSLERVLAKNRSSRKDPATFLWFPLFIYCCDFETERMHVPDMGRELRRLLREKKIGRKNYELMMEKIGALGDFSMNFPRRDEFERMLRREMTLSKVIRGNEFSPFSCIFVLKKKL